MNPHELVSSHAELVTLYSDRVMPCYRSMQKAVGFTFAVCGFGASGIQQDDRNYLNARAFGERMAKEGIPVVAGGPYTVDGRGRGIQHALHEGAFGVRPDMSIGCELLMPAWGDPEQSPCEPNLRNPDLLTTRLPTMFIISSCFISFGRASFGTDLERAATAQLLWFVRNLCVEGVPEEVFVGNAALRCGFIPKLGLVGTSYEYTKVKVRRWIDEGLIPSSVADPHEGAYTYLADEVAAEEFVLRERARYRQVVVGAGHQPDN